MGEERRRGDERENGIPNENTKKENEHEQKMDTGKAGRK